MRKKGDVNREYMFRRLTKGNKTGDAYGLTIPRVYVKKYKLLGKKFQIRVSPYGKFILYSQVKRKTKKK